MVNEERILKGVFGLRLSYLSMDRDVRDHIRERLNDRQNPLQVAQSISVRGVTFDLYADDKDFFAEKLGQLLGDAKYERDYIRRADQLPEHYRDIPEDRDNIWKKWTDPNLEDDIREGAKQALAPDTEVDVSGAEKRLDRPRVDPTPGPQGRSRLLFRASLAEKGGPLLPEPE